MNIGCPPVQRGDSIRGLGIGLARWILGDPETLQEHPVVMVGVDFNEECGVSKCDGLEPPIDDGSPQAT